MRTPAQIAGHPIHPMLVALPIGMWVFSLVADLIALGSATPDAWHAAAFYTMVGGLIGAVAAAIPGLVDLLSLRDAAARSTAIKHMALNLTVVVLYAINAWTRASGALSPDMALLLSVVAIALLLVSGWLGGKMVYEEGVAVHAGETGTSDAWSRPRGTRARVDTGGSGWARGDRAMAADSERPSRGDSASASRRGPDSPE